MWVVLMLSLPVLRWIGQQLLERMAHDPNFKPTGKDAAETFLESGANLLSIGFPGFVGKYARFKDAREFNKKFDFTDQDIAELKRFGYDGLRSPQFPVFPTLSQKFFPKFPWEPGLTFSRDCWF